MWFYLLAALKSQSGVCEKNSQPHPGSHMRARVPRPPIQCWDVRDWSQGPADDCFFARAPHSDAGCTTLHAGCGVAKVWNRAGVM